MTSGVTGGGSDRRCWETENDEMIWDEGMEEGNMVNMLKDGDKENDKDTEADEVQTDEGAMQENLPDCDKLQTCKCYKSTNRE